jgi:glycosyltransferase involved in cell wall biosynthesis
MSDDTMQARALAMSATQGSGGGKWTSQAGNPAPSKRLSILVLSPDPQVHGGVSTFIESVKTYLNGCDVTSLWVGSVQNRRENILASAWRVISLPFTVMRIVRRKHFDVVHINPSLDAKSLVRDGLILLALKMAGFHKVMVYFHGWRSELAARIMHNAVLRPIFLWLLADVDRIMVLSPDFKKTLEEIGVDGRKIVFTRTMFDGGSVKAVEHIDPNPARRSILFMSRFVAAKGVYELLKAFSRIAADFPDVDVVMAGDGPENAGLQKKTVEYGLQERVRFTGYITGDKKFILLRQCSIFALPTYFTEGMPVALLEAMGAGKPLLTARAGVIGHIIADPDNGIVLDKVTADTVESGLRRMLSDRDYCRKTGKANEAYAWGHFEAAIVTAEIKAIYHDISCH